MTDSALKRRGLLFCLVGPAGSGKTTVGEKIVEQGGILRSISVTSRPPRAQEKDGLDYHFVSREDFQRRVWQGEFFEWEEIHDNLYGTLRSTLSNAITDGQDLLLIIDIKGALNVKNSFPRDTFILFLAPPSAEVLTQRMQSRGTMDAKELQVRLETARQEYRTLYEVGLHEKHGIDYLVVNDRMDDACQKVTAIMIAERLRLSRVSTDELRRLCEV